MEGVLGLCGDVSDDVHMSFGAPFTARCRHLLLLQAWNSPETGKQKGAKLAAAAAAPNEISQWGDNLENKAATRANRPIGERHRVCTGFAFAGKATQSGSGMCLIILMGDVDWRNKDA